MATNKPETIGARAIRFVQRQVLMLIEGMQMPTKPAVFGQQERRKERERYRGTKQERGYGGEWERISQIVRKAQPVCMICHDAASEDVDHIVPFNGLSDPLRTARSNLRAVCRECHNRKTRGQG